jgi:hypothetical protein
MKLLILVLAVMFTVQVTAQTLPERRVRQVLCVSGQDLTVLTDQFEETPVARGITFDGIAGSLVIFIGPTGSFTVVERTDDDTYCVLAVGVKFESVPADIQKESQQRQQKGRL